MLTKLNSTTTITPIQLIGIGRKSKQLIKSFVEDLFNKHNLAAIDKYHAGNLTDGSGKTSESFKKSLAAPFQAFLIYM